MRWGILNASEQGVSAMANLFRGQSAAVWRERFEDAGWPPEAASRMVDWLTGKITEEPPEWPLFEGEPQFPPYKKA